MSSAWPGALGFDMWFLRILHQLHGTAADAVLTPLSRLLALMGVHGIFMLAVGVILLFFRRTRKSGFAILLGVALSYIVTNIIIKPLVARPRPYADEAGILYQWWLQAGSFLETDFSFPSGHANASMALASGFFFSGSAKRRWPIFIFPLLMGLSRCYIVVHYPTDVLAGLAIGLLGGLVAAYLLKRIYSALENRKRRAA